MDYELEMTQRRARSGYLGEEVQRLVEWYDATIERIRAVQTEMALADQQADGVKA